MRMWYILAQELKKKKKKGTLSPSPPSLPCDTNTKHP